MNVVHFDESISTDMRPVQEIQALSLSRTRARALSPSLPACLSLCHSLSRALSLAHTHTNTPFHTTHTYDTQPIMVSCYLKIVYNGI
jgi:hypothetical protein